MPRRGSRPGNRVTFGTVVSHLGVIIAVAAVLGVLTAGLVIPFVGLAGYGAKATADSLQNLPSELKATPLSQRSRVLDRNGNPIAAFYDENRVNVPLSKVAPIMQKAIIAIEDYRFYQHGALDLKGTLRAFVNNQTSGNTQGGSSITQQMAKMTQLAQARTAAERKAATANTYQRKILELRHAIAFEQNYSKDWILERYLNLAYFGDGAYGVQAAARHYFSVNASQLSIVQAATLAGLVKNPVGFDPTDYRDRAVARRNVVLARMARAARDPRRDRREPGARPARPQGQPGPQRVPGHQGAVLLRLRTPLPAGRPRVGPHRRGPPAAAQQRRPDHQDHGRPALPARCRRRGQGSRSTRRTRPSARSRWSSPAPARCWRSPSRARWDGRRRRARPSSTTS